jgi:hypothetical protein
LGARLSFIVLLAWTGSASAQGADDAPEVDADAEAHADEIFAKYSPPPVDGPALRLPVSPSWLYVDATLATTDDLSGLPYVAGTGRNVPFAIGGGWRWRRYALSAEIPFAQVSTLDVTAIPGGMPIPQDMHQTAVSFGDIRLGVDWTEHLTPALVGGFGLRGRFPTHTTRFRFHLIDGSLASYSFPYYFHIEPTAILGGVFGRFMMVVNQGAIVLLGPDGDFSDQHIVVPTIFFWDAHYAISYAPLDFLAASLELGTDIQLNKVGGIDFQKLNDVRSVWLAPALQVHVGDYRVDLIARLGLTRGADLFGVIEYAGTRSYTLRLSRTFN